MKINLKLLALIILFFGAFLLRIYRIDSVPASLYYDEVDLGYQARSLIETHKDYKGRQSPFYELSFNDPKTPIPIIFSIPATLLFKSEELQVRITPAIFGVLVVLLSFLITKAVTKKFWLAFLVGAVFATNPWQIQFSRWAVEGIFSLGFYLISLFLFLKSLTKHKFLYLMFSVILFSLTVYTYRTMSLFIPLTFLTLTFVYFKDLIEFGFRKLIICVITSLIIILPFLYATTIGAPDVSRFSQLSITSNKLIPVLIQRDRELDSNDFKNPTVGKNASKLSYFFHNKPLSYIRIFYKNYLETFSTDFLFLNGVPNQRESVGELGELFYIDIFALVAGFLFIITNIRKKDKLSQFCRLIFILFLLSPIPSSLTYDGAKHGPRLLVFSIPLLIIVGFGWWQIIKFINNLKFRNFFLLILILGWISCFVFYCHRYFVEYPVQSAGDFGFGFKQMSQEVGALASKYNFVYLSEANDPPMIYILFWNHIPPSVLQQHGPLFEVDRDYPTELNKYKVLSLHISDAKAQEDLAQTLKKNILYVYSGKDLPKQIHTKDQAPAGTHIIDIIKYPNNESAFYLIEKI